MKTKFYFPKKLEFYILKKIKPNAMNLLAMKKILTLSYFMLFTFCLHAQKKTMNHDVYGIWKKIEQQRISNDGKWISYITLSNTEGDPMLYLWNAANSSTTTFEPTRAAEFAIAEMYSPISFGSQSLSLNSTHSVSLGSLQSSRTKRAKFSVVWLFAI